MTPFFPYYLGAVVFFFFVGGLLVVAVTYPKAGQWILLGIFILLAVMYIASMIALFVTGYYKTGIMVSFTLFSFIYELRKDAKRNRETNKQVEKIRAKLDSYQAKK
jgi:cytochrome b subunit of formate dehydrogenase